MKCPCCNGTGRTQMVTLVQGADFPCIECNGTGEIEMTNEYFMRTATTEQLAEVLADVSLWNHPFMKQKNRFELLKKQFYMWLKQPHTNE